MNSTRKNILILLILLVMTGLSNLAHAEVWVQENTWSEDWELKYKEWLKTATHAQFFATPTLKDGTPNPYYGIRVDCADLVYSLRIIFSYENKLPFAMNNPVSPKGALITNNMTRFDKFPEGNERLKRFLVWLYDIVSTTSIPRDTYSVAFNEVGPGTIILTSKKNHHSWTIKNISKAGNPTLIYNSTVERESGFEVQIRHSWPNPFWIFEPEVDATNPMIIKPVYLPGSYAGFRYWRPMEYLKQPEATVPKFSDEQHIVGIGKWKGYAQKHLVQVQESMDQVVLRLLNDACADLKQRVAAVGEAEAYKANLAKAILANDPSSPYLMDLTNDPEAPADRRCMIYKKFDQFSTPSRDRRLVDAIMLARAYYQLGISKKGEALFRPENLDIFKAIFPFITKSAAEEAMLDTTAKSSSGFCSVKISPQVGYLSLAEAKRRIFRGRFSPNPNDSYPVRFGFSKTSKDLGAECPTYDLSPNTIDLNKAEADANREAESSMQVL